MFVSYYYRPRHNQSPWKCSEQGEVRALESAGGEEGPLSQHCHVTQLLQEENTAGEGGVGKGHHGRQTESRDLDNVKTRRRTFSQGHGVGKGRKWRGVHGTERSGWLGHSMRWGGGGRCV